MARNDSGHLILLRQRSDVKLLIIVFVLKD